MAFSLETICQRILEAIQNPNEELNDTIFSYFFSQCDNFLSAKRPPKDLEKFLNKICPEIIQSLLERNPKVKFVNSFFEKICLLFIKYFDEQFLPFLEATLKILLDLSVQLSTPPSLSIRNARYNAQKLLFDSDFFVTIIDILKNELSISIYNIILKLYNAFNEQLYPKLLKRLFRLICKHFLNFVATKPTKLSQLKEIDACFILLIQDLNPDSEILQILAEH
jgi:hypothetical protein